MSALRLIVALVLALGIGTSAHAQTVHRTNVPAGDATPTGGSFSIRFPIPFTDMETKAADTGHPTATLLMVTGVNDDGVRLSATEAPYGGLQPKSMESFMDDMKSQPGAAASDVYRGRSGDMEILSFGLTVPGHGYYFRMVRAHDIQYLQVIQFPEADRAEAAAMKDDFFSSFKITKP
jgi:hypothetical protein